jgi:hypothetical protein
MFTTDPVSVTGTGANAKYTYNVVRDGAADTVTLDADKNDFVKARGVGEYDIDRYDNITYTSFVELMSQLTWANNTIVHAANTYGVTAGSNSWTNDTTFTVLNVTDGKINGTFTMTTGKNYLLNATSVTYGFVVSGGDKAQNVYVIVGDTATSATANLTATTVDNDVAKTYYVKNGMITGVQLDAPIVTFYGVADNAPADKDNTAATIEVSYVDAQAAGDTGAVSVIGGTVDSVKVNNNKADVALSSDAVTYTVVVKGANGQNYTYTLVQDGVQVPVLFSANTDIVNVDQSDGIAISSEIANPNALMISSILNELRVGVDADGDGVADVDSNGDTIVADNAEDLISIVVTDAAGKVIPESAYSTTSAEGYTITVTLKDAAGNDVGTYTNDSENPYTDLALVAAQEAAKAAITEANFPGLDTYNSDNLTVQNAVKALQEAIDGAETLEELAAIYDSETGKFVSGDEEDSNVTALKTALADAADETKSVYDRDPDKAETADEYYVGIANAGTGEKAKNIAIVVWPKDGNVKTDCLTYDELTDLFGSVADIVVTDGNPATAIALATGENETGSYFDGDTKQTWKFTDQAWKVFKNAQWGTSSDKTFTDAYGDTAGWVKVHVASAPTDLETLTVTLVSNDAGVKFESQTGFFATADSSTTQQGG